MNNEEENKRGILSTLVRDGAKTAWKKLPFTVKIKIVGGLAVVLLILLFFVVLASGVPMNFLDYSTSATTSNNIDKEFEEFWYDYCGDDKSCSEEEKKEAERVKKSQKQFFNLLDKLVRKYDLNDEQRYMVLTTIFMNYDIDKFSEDNGFEFDENEQNINNGNSSDETLDSSVNLNVNSSGNIYVEEKSTLKELMKQFEIYSAKCVISDSETYDLMKNENEPYKFTFWEYAKYKLKISSPNAEGFDDAVNACQGEIKYSKSLSNDNYYEYLENSKYFDKRDNFRSYFIEYATANNLDIGELDNWASDDLVTVRKRITADIKSIVSDYVKLTPKSILSVVTTNKNFWWPIGSAETTESAGHIYATGDPATVGITSLFGYRIHPIYGRGHGHSGIDISGLGVVGEVNVIASRSGVVTEVETSCISYGDKSCGRTYGNHIIIMHSDGTHTVYGHLHQGTVTVSLNQKVEQGEVIGKVGSSGSSTGPHLHFEIRLDKSFDSKVDPLDYIDPENPRPTSVLSEEFMAMIESLEGGPKSSNGEYTVICNKDDVPTVGHGVTLTYQYPRFEKYGITLVTNNEYKNYCGTTMPVSVVDAIYEDILIDYSEAVKSVLAVSGITLEQNQIEALTSLRYNCGTIEGFISAYNLYGSSEALCNNWWHTYRVGNNANTDGLIKRRRNECNLFVNGIYNGSYS